MQVVHTPLAEQHDPKFFLVRGKIVPSAERPERARLFRAAAERAGLISCAAKEHPQGALKTVHTERYLKFLATAFERWQELPDAGPEVVPNVHPQRYAATYPSALVGQVGWHLADTACPIGKATFQAACASAGVALTAADLVVGGEPAAYALCRPPGHHAYADMAGGFCYLNNSALAAERLAGFFGRVALLDIDVHHGNGTQAIFWRRPDVMTVSVHADPAEFYPFFWGHAHETGECDGAANLNLPLPVGTNDQAWLAAMAAALAAIRVWAAPALVVALGLDAHEADPLKGMRVTAKAFAEAATMIRDVQLPTVLVQEGGYLSPDVGEALERFLIAFNHA